MVLVFGFFKSFAASNGVIDNLNHSALLCKDNSCTITSSINFKTTIGRVVHVTDDELTGDIWSEDMGWINLDPSKSGVLNDGDGHLSGYAWGENAGWINFNPTNGGVDIVDGEFSGYAWAQNYGWIKFDCSSSSGCVKTDWSKESNGSGGGSTGGSTGGNGTIDVGPGGEGTGDTGDIINNNTNNTNNTSDINNGDNTNVLDNNDINNENNDNSEENENNGLGGIFDNLINNDINNIFTGLNDFLENNISPVITKYLQDPALEVSTKIVITSSAVLGAVVNVTSSLFSSVMGFSDLLMFPVRLWNLFLIFFGIRKRNEPWGTVYDSVTKQPLDPAYVILQNEKGEEVSSSITDLDGRYGFLVSPGRYKLFANKTNYKFPSEKLFGRTSDEVYNDLYFNEFIDIKEGESVVIKNIPMDPLNFDWNEFAKNKQGVMRFFSKKQMIINIIADVLFILGLVLSTVVAFVTPSTYNTVILCIYLILIILKFTVFKTRSFGTISYKGSKVPLSFAIIRVFFAESRTEVVHKIADKTGKYLCLIPNGSYFLKIEAKKEDGGYQEVYESQVFEVKNGLINERFEI